MVKQVGNVDGIIDALENARIPVADRGFLYGDSVYEVFRTYHGLPFLFEEHYQRLLNSAALIGMDIKQSQKEILNSIRETVAASEPQLGEDVYVRYQITRGEGPIDLNPDLSESTRMVIIVKAIPKWNPQHYDVGMSLAVTQLRRNSVNSLDPNIKGGNYLNNIMALSEARKNGADDCLMLDADDLVTECSNSNIWFVLNGALVAPVAGNLDGLTRGSVVELATNNGLPLEQRPVHNDELAHAEECFVTSATREVMPVKSLRLVDGRVVEFEDGGGPLSRAVMNLYAEMLTDFVADNTESPWF
jgi:branched-chain amino acid aminotransferase